MANATPSSVPLTPAPPATCRQDYWRALLEECRGSGLSQAEFCRRRGLARRSLSFWKHKLAREAGRAVGSWTSVSRERPAFVPVRIASRRPPRVEAQTGTPSAWGGEIEIALESGRLVRVRGRLDAQGLRQVLVTLESVRC